MTEIVETSTSPSPAPEPNIPAPRAPASVVGEVLSRLREQLTAVLPDEIPIQSFEVAVLQCALKDPDLERCDPGSIADAVLGCARLGLMPAGLEEHAIIRSQRSDDGELRAKTIAMVNGLVYLARKGGRVLEIDGETVREGETYRFSKLANVLEHDVTFPRKERIIAAYGYADTIDSTGAIRRVFELMDVAEIQLAESYSGGNIAWRVNQHRMAIKSAKKRVIYGRNLLSASTMAALAKVSVEFESPMRAAELPAPAPKVEGDVKREGLSPASSKLLDKVTKASGAKPAPPAAKKPEPKPAPKGSPKAKKAKR